MIKLSLMNYQRTSVGIDEEDDAILGFTYPWSPQW